MVVLRVQSVGTARSILACLLLCVTMSAVVESASRTSSDSTVVDVPPPLTPGEEYVPPNSPRYNYAEALHKSFLFYRSQQSGKIEEAGQRRLAWRKNSCFACVGKYGEDLSMGFYEAANTMRWGLPNSFVVTQLAWNIYEFGSAMASVNELTEAKQILRWAADFLIASHPQPNQFVGQLGSSTIDFQYYGPPEHYETDAQGPKPVVYVNDTHPASEIVCEAAAALAVTSMVFRQEDPAYADSCLSHSQSLYTLGITYQGSYKNFQDAIWKEANDWYPSSDFKDEIAWAAYWLYIATGNATYLADCKQYYPNEPGWGYDWADKGPALNVLLARATGEASYHTNAKAYFDQFLPGATRKVPHTPKGLMWLELWSSTTYAANTAFLCFVYQRTALNATDPYGQRLFNYGLSQINYILGDIGRSFIGGFGVNPPLLPYHVSSYNSILGWPMRNQTWDKQQDDFLNSATPNRHILYGALVGGPTNNDSWYDNRNNYEYTEVTLDYNAGYTGALAALIQTYGGKPFSDCGLDLGWNYPGADPRPTYPANDCYHGCCDSSSTGGVASSSSTAASTSSSSTAGSSTADNTARSSTATSPTGDSSSSGNNDRTSSSSSSSTGGSDYQQPTVISTNAAGATGTSAGLIALAVGASLAAGLLIFAGNEATSRRRRRRTEKLN